MRHKVPSRKRNIPSVSLSSFSFPFRHVFAIPAMLIAITLCMVGCVSQQTQAWNHYEEGMLLVYKGYDAKGDKTDKVEKAFNKAIECNKDIPGARASLGTYLARKGDTSGAMELWTEERKIHPESKKAMDIVLEKNKGKEDALAPAPASTPGTPATTETKTGDKQTEPEKKEAKSV